MQIRPDIFPFFSLKMKPVQRLLIQAGCLFFIAFVVYVIYSADHGTLPRALSQLYHFPGGDKVGHVVMFALLTLVANALLHPRGMQPGSRSIPLGTLVIAVLITLEEISQLLIPSRTFDLRDLACTYLGIILATAGYLRSEQRRRSREPGTSRSGR